MRRASWSWAASVTLAAASLLTAFAVDVGTARAADVEPFSISGEIDGLYPGFVGTIPVVLRSESSRPLRVTQVRVRVSEAGPGCPATMLSVADTDLHLVLQPNGQTVVPMEVRMARTAPDSCRGATFALAFTGVGDDIGEPSTLPRTGIDAVGLAMLGAALVAGGLIALRIGVRKRTGIATLLVVLTVVVTLTAFPDAAVAGWGGNAGGGARSSGETLAAPGSLAGAGSCTNIVLGPRVVLTWTSTPSVFASGYDVLRSTTNGGPYTAVGFASGRNTVTFTDTTVSGNTTYYYRLRAVVGSWKSPNTAQVTATTPLLCL